jgi:hypothetical protein
MTEKIPLLRQFLANYFAFTVSGVSSVVLLGRMLDLIRDG